MGVWGACVVAGGWEALAIASAGIHVLGYATYISLVRRGAIEANPLSWLMFAYGTGLLTFLEYESGASWRELLLPIACSVSSIVVAGLCVRATRVHELAFSDLAAFAIDLALTGAYVGLWFLERQGMGDALAGAGIVALLVCANATTLASFVPLLRSTFTHPERERIFPWLLWTLAYGLLFAVTAQDGTSTNQLALLLYPGLNALLHFSVALLTCSRWWRPERRTQFEVRETGSTGLGMFTPVAFRRGDRVFVLQGTVRRWRSQSDADARRNENWFGIGKDLWIEPEAPFMFLNHSCDPNLGVRGEREFVALRDIETGEELTFDYSITEDERSWSMHCQCGSAACRGTIGSVHALPYEVFLRYLPYIGGHFRREYLRGRRAALKSAAAYEFPPASDDVQIARGQPNS